MTKQKINAPEVHYSTTLKSVEKNHILTIFNLNLKDTICNILTQHQH